MKKKNNTYQFLNIIEKEKFDNYTQDEKEKFLIDAKIYILKEDLNQPFYTSPDENGNILLDDFDESTYLNNLVLREMVTWFKEVQSYWVEDYYEYKYDFKNRIKRALDNSDKVRIIRRDYEKYSDMLNNDTSTDNYFSNNTSEGDIHDCIKAFNNREEVIEYLTNKTPFLNVMIPFEACEQIKIWVEILKFLKEEMNKTTRSNKEKDIKPKSTTPLHFNDNIFRTIEAKNWFYNTLINMGALEEYNTPKKRKFQPICHAIFYSLDCKKKIFRYNLELKDFILFFNKEYKTNITSKLSNGDRHVEEVEELLINII